MYYFKIDLDEGKFLLCSTSGSSIKNGKKTIIQKKTYDKITDALSDFKNYLSKNINNTRNKLLTYSDCIDYIAEYCNSNSFVYVVKVGIDKFIFVDDDELIENLKYFGIISIHHVKDRIIKVKTKNGYIFLDFTFCPYNVGIVSALTKPDINPDYNDLEFIIKVLKKYYRARSVDEVYYYRVIYDDNIYTLKDLIPKLKSDCEYRLNILDYYLGINGCSLKNGACIGYGQCLSKDLVDNMCIYYKDFIYKCNDDAYVTLNCSKDGWFVDTNYIYVFSIYI